MQVASRLLLVWAIVNNFLFLAKSAGYSSMLIAWSVTEVIRYSYFVLTLSGYSPSFITWLRYNTFYVLYPLGISSECWMIYKAIEPARNLRQEYAWVLQLILFIYIPGKSYESYTVAMLISIRILHPLYTYDGTEKEGHERETGQKGRLDNRRRLQGHQNRVNKGRWWMSGDSTYIKIMIICSELHWSQKE